VSQTAIVTDLGTSVQDYYCTTLILNNRQFCTVTHASLGAMEFVPMDALDSVDYTTVHGPYYISQSDNTWGSLSQWLANPRLLIEQGNAAGTARMVGFRVLTSPASVG